MNDVLMDIFFITLVVLFYLCLAFLIVLLPIGIYGICNTNKPKKKYYLIKYKFIYDYEIIIKSKNSLEARLKFQRKYKEYNFVSIKEIENE